MANLVLDINYDYDFSLFGIVSNIRDYKIAWWLNKVLGVHFSKLSEIDLFEGYDDKVCFISGFVFESETFDFTLIKNKSVEFSQVSKPYLLPELKEYDYFIMFGGESDIYSEKSVKECLYKVPFITYSQSIDVSRLKQKENLLII